jgi:hypothetical protein
MPKDKPKTSPEIVPIFPGTSSRAYTRVTEKLDRIINPFRIRSIHPRQAYKR